MDEIQMNKTLLFLVKNSSYFLTPFKSAKVKYKEMTEVLDSDENWYYDTDWYIPPLQIELEVLNKFLNIPKYDWYVIKPLFDSGLIWINDGNGVVMDQCFAHLSDKFRSNARKSLGSVKDYNTGICYLHFYIGNCNPNDLIDKTKLTKVR